MGARTPTGPVGSPYFLVYWYEIYLVFRALDTERPLIANQRRLAEGPWIDTAFSRLVGAAQQDWEETLSPQVREDALAAMLEGIISAFHAAQQASARSAQDPFNDCMDYAHAAFASLEAGGFSVVWKGVHPEHRDWRERPLKVANGTFG